MAIDLQALADEYTINPVGMPYLAFVEANSVANADIINNAAGQNPRTVNYHDISTGDIRANVTLEGFDGLVTVNQAYLEWLTGGGSGGADSGAGLLVNTEILQNLAGVPIPSDSIWAAADRDEMNAAMAALMQYQGSRAQQLEDVLGVSFVTPSQVRDATNL